MSVLGWVALGLFSIAPAGPSSSLLKMAHSPISPELLASLQQVSQATAVACVTAQQRGGRLTGTVTVSQQGMSYAPRPSNELILQLGPERIRLSVKQCRSQAGGNIKRFLKVPHTIEARFRLKGQDLRFLEHEGRGGSRAYFKGTVKSGKRRLRLNLQVRKTTRSESDASGAGSKSVGTITGTVRGKGFVIDAAVQSVEEFQATARQSANSKVTRLNTQLKTGGATYRWNNVTLKTSFFDGHPSSVDSFWGARGQVTKDGAPWGHYQMTQKGRLRFELKTPERAITVGSFRP